MLAVGTVADMAAAFLSLTQDPTVRANAARFCPLGLQTLLHMLINDARNALTIVDGVADAVHAMILCDARLWEQEARRLVEQAPSVATLLAQLQPTHTAQQFNRLTKVAYRKVVRALLATIQQSQGLA